MKKLTLLGTTIPVLVAVTLISSAFAGFDFLSIDSGDVILNDDEDAYVFIADLNGTIPNNSNHADIESIPLIPIGVAWVDGTCEGCNFTAATIHPDIVDSRQNPDNWHPHTGTFVNGTSDELCIGTLESPHAGIAKNDDILRVNMPIQSSNVTPDNAAVAATFFLTPSGACPPVPVDLPGNGLKPNTVSPPLPGLLVTVLDGVGIP